MGRKKWHLRVVCVCVVVGCDDRTVSERLTSLGAHHPTKHSLRIVEGRY
jgi:hypothetical protein